MSHGRHKSLLENFFDEDPLKELTDEGPSEAVPPSLSPFPGKKFNPEAAEFSVKSLEKAFFDGPPVYSSKTVSSEATRLPTALQLELALEENPQEALLPEAPVASTPSSPIHSAAKIETIRTISCFDALLDRIEALSLSLDKPLEYKEKKVVEPEYFHSTTSNISDAKVDDTTADTDTSIGTPPVKSPLKMQPSGRFGLTEEQKALLGFAIVKVSFNHHHKAAFRLALPHHHQECRIDF